MTPRSKRLAEEARDRSILRALAWAMEAKQRVFKAQDAIEVARQENDCLTIKGERNLKREYLIDKLEQKLARVREELERIDVLVTDAGLRNQEQETGVGAP